MWSINEFGKGIAINDVIDKIIENKFVLSQAISKNIWK